MDIDGFMNQAWNDHQTDAATVAARLPEGAKLIQDTAQIPGLVNLAAHVFGEHLGQWKDGLAFLEQLRNLPFVAPDSESEKAIARSIAVLEIGNGNDSAANGFSNSDQTRILATAASALSGQGQTERAQRLFLKALEIARQSINSEDPANRALAVTGNNLACALEEKESRSSSEVELMILAAKAARHYWEIAGTWLEVERAEYRLAMTYLKAENSAEAYNHAQTCLETIRANSAEPLEYFFGFEALASVEQARGNTSGGTAAVEQLCKTFEQLSEDDKLWCADVLKRFT